MRIQGLLLLTARMLIIAGVIALGTRANADTLSVSVTVFGPQNDFTWDVNITNSNSFALTNAEISNISIVQTFGAASTPVILTPSPVLLGTISGNSTATGAIDIDFTGAPSNALFDLGATFVADQISGSLSVPNLPDSFSPDNFVPPFPGMVTLNSSGAPGPALGGGLPGVFLAVAGLISWRRMRKKAARISA